MQCRSAQSVRRQRSRHPVRGILQAVNNAENSADTPRETGTISGLTRGDLDLSATLRSGQAFRWTGVPSDNGADVWAGVAPGGRRARLWQVFEPDAAGDETDAGTLHFEADGPNAETAIRRFLRIGEADLPALARDWRTGDAAFRDAWTRQPGVRILRQDPDECFFSFLCASVAPIARISAMLRGVARTLGTPLGGDENETGLFIRFPTTAQIARSDEATLRALGLGFRARRLIESARVLERLPADHLSALRDNATHAEAKRELTAFFGVGEKIADCVCLFALDKDGAIPVDTHIWRIAQTRYAPDLAGRSLTPASYARVTEAFHERFGPRAGWAQQTLFYRAAVGRGA